MLPNYPSSPKCRARFFCGMAVSRSVSHMGQESCSAMFFGCVPVPKAAAPKKDAYDGYSSHYCASVNGEPVVLRVTHAARGPIECQEYYPVALLAHREILVSSSRFYARDDRVVGRDVPMKLLKSAWSAGAKIGARIDVTNCHIRGVLYYSRIGYVPIASGQFKHPILGTPSQSILITADPDHPSPFQSIFSALPDPFPLDQIHRSVPVERNALSAGAVARLKRETSRKDNVLPV